VKFGAEWIVHIITDALQFHEPIVVLSKDFELRENSFVADHCKQLQSFKEVEIDGGWIVADQVIVLAKVLNNSWKEGLVKFDWLGLIILIVTKSDDLPSELIKKTGEHVHLCLVLGILSEQSLVPHFSDILVNGNRFGHLRVTVNEIWNVRELQTEVLLVSQEPVLVAKIVLLIKVNTTVRKLIPDIRAKSSNSPVSKDRSALDVDFTLFHEINLDVIAHEGGLIFKICDIARENCSVKEL
jgi:hypothetical protein